MGKERAALALAIERIARGDDLIARRIAGGNHPDVRVFRPREDGIHNIQVEFVRSEILPFTQFAPFEADSAFVIFPEADVSFPVHKPESANALLKTLEEPRPNLHFILLAERPHRLLTTIRSRCQPLRFVPLGSTDLDAILTAEGIADTVRGPAIALARGRADRALELARSGDIEAVFERALDAHMTLGNARPGELLKVSERVAKLNEDAQGLELEALALLYRDLALTAIGASGASGEGLAFRKQRAQLGSTAKGQDPRKMAARESAIRRSLETLGRNANAQVVLDALMFELAR